MESGYDENLVENVFFKTLHNEYESIFQKAVSENWIICVPCSESLKNYDLNEYGIFTHILIPSDELPGIHFRNLNEDDVRMYNYAVKLQNFPSIPVLFSEVFYADEIRYKVMCLECPLNCDFNSQNFNPRLYLVKTLKDCFDLLMHESSNESVIKKLDEIIKQYLFLSSKNYFNKSLDQQVSFMREIYRRCLQVVTYDKKISLRMKENRVFSENVQIAVESYLLHNMYPIIMKGLITNTTTEIGLFNKTLRNLANIQLQHLKVVDTLFDSILKARVELSHFGKYHTVLGKVSCLKRCINVLSSKSANQLCVDDLLPILVFLVVKSGITTWIAQLKFVKEFSFSHTDYNYASESSFLITTLEAILTFIQSGLFYKSIYSSELNLIKMPDGQSEVCTYICGRSKLFWKTKHPLLLILFQNIYNDDLPSVCSQLQGQVQESVVPSESEYCHPLCSCDRCEKLFANTKQATALTVNSANESGYSPLHVAVCYGKCSIVDWLLNNGANPNCADFFGSTALHCAAQHGDQNTILLLIYGQAKLDPKDDDGNTPLHFAAVNGHTDCVKALLYFAEQANIRLDVNESNKDGDTALHLAVKYYYKNITEILLNYNASPSIKNKHENTAFELTESLNIKAILSEKHDSVNLLVVSPNVPMSLTSKEEDKLIFEKRRMPKDEFGIQPHTAEGIKNALHLFKAAKDNDIRTLKRYLGFGGSDSSIDSPDSVALPAAKCHPLCRCDKCFVDVTSCNDDNDDADGFGKINATSPNICDADGFTALHIACKYGRTETMQFLLDMGANLNVGTYKQFLTPLHIVCIQNHLSAAKILLSRNSCRINLQDRSGNTALHYACMAGNVRIVEFLLKYEPDLEIRNDRGKTALNEAEESLSYSVMTMLKSSSVQSKEEEF